jgi:hypothetical protein
MSAIMRGWFLVLDRCVSPSHDASYGEPTLERPPVAEMMIEVASAGTTGALSKWYDFYIFATASALIFGQISHTPCTSQ